MKTIIVTGILTAVVLTAISVLSAERSAPAPRIERVEPVRDQELDAMKERLRALDEAHSRLAKQLQHTSRTAEKIEAREQEERESKEPPPSPQPTAQQLAEALELTIETEPADPQWAPRAEVELEEAVANIALPGVALQEVTCKQALCKVSLALEEGTSRDDLFRRLVRAIRWNAPRAIRFESEASAIAYFARDGHQLPSL